MSAIATTLKRSTLALALVAGLAALGAGGAAQAASVRIGIGFAPYGPPPPRHEYVPYHHGRYDVWQPGHWEWTGHRYRWVSGHYIRAPYRGAQWTDGRWEHRGQGYYWNDGRWR